MSSPHLVEHFFRHEYSRLVAMLANRVGVQYIEDVEDAVQSALMTALETWPVAGLPKRPAAWLYRVAYHSLLSEFRKQSNRRRILETLVSEEVTGFDEGDDAYLESEVRDDLLRMMFLCCDDSLPQESQLVLALKTLCGFDVREISYRLFTSTDNVYKRLGRARSRLKDRHGGLRDLTDQFLSDRLPSVQRVLYVLFTEGYLSVRSDLAIRRELCDEAIRLMTILVEHPVGQLPEAYALMALMHLHRARLTARENESGGLLLLEEQDRSLWDEGRIQTGLCWLAKSSEGSEFSRYHAEAGIAAEHCLAPSFQETRWDRVVECYQLLERVAPSPIHRLNRAVAVAEWKGADEGLKLLEDFEPPGWLRGSYLWAAVFSDLNRRCGHVEIASRYREVALKSAPSEAVKNLLDRRLRIEIGNGKGHAVSP